MNDALHDPCTGLRASQPLKVVPLCSCKRRKSLRDARCNRCTEQTDPDGTLFRTFSSMKPDEKGVIASQSSEKCQSMNMQEDTLTIPGELDLQSIKPSRSS